MVEIVLVSVGIVALVLFLMNMRNVSPRTGVAPRLLDGSPHWVAGTIQSVDKTGTYCGLTTASLTLALGTSQQETSGPIPVRYEAEIRPGLAVEGHVEYDQLDTLRTQLWDCATDAVLRACAADLGVSTEPTGDDLEQLAFELGGREMTVLLAEDGWVTIVTDSEAVPRDMYVDLRADFDESEGAMMLTERLGATQDHAEEARAFLRALSPATLERLEAFAVGAGGWICIDEGFEFECALPFAEGGLIATLVREALEIARLVESDHGAAESVSSDGAW